jgi:hypothetical protein
MGYGKRQNDHQAEQRRRCVVVTAMCPEWDSSDDGYPDGFLVQQFLLPQRGTTEHRQLGMISPILQRMCVGNFHKKVTTRT